MKHFVKIITGVPILGRNTGFQFWTGINIFLGITTGVPILGRHGTGNLYAFLE